VIPRARDEIIQMLRVIPFQNLVNLHRPVEVFLIPPARDIQIRYRGLGQEKCHRLLLPESVVVRMSDEIVPGGQCAVEVVLVGVRKRAEPQIPLVGVEAVELEREIGLSGLHQGGVFEPVAEAERTIVVEVVTQKHVGRRSLLGDGFEGRMRLQHAHNSQPAAIGNA
jgi:hypothetical protein